VEPSITDQHLVIERSDLLARTVGPHEAMSPGGVVGFHIKQPSILTNGWIQLCISEIRPELGCAAAPSDPHTMPFKRNRRDQMRQLLRYLQQLVDYNRHQPTISAPATPSAGLATRTVAATPVASPSSSAEPTARVPLTDSRSHHRVPARRCSPGRGSSGSNASTTSSAVPMNPTNLSDAEPCQVVLP